MTITITACAAISDTTADTTCGSRSDRGPVARGRHRHPRGACAAATTRASSRGSGRSRSAISDAARPKSSALAAYGPERSFRPQPRREAGARPDEQRTHDRADRAARHHPADRPRPLGGRVDLRRDVSSELQGGVRHAHAEQAQEEERQRPQRDRRAGERRAAETDREPGRERRPPPVPFHRASPQERGERAAALVHAGGHARPGRTSRQRRADDRAHGRGRQEARGAEALRAEEHERDPPGLGRAHAGGSGTASISCSRRMSTPTAPSSVSTYMLAKRAPHLTSSAR